MSLEDDFIAAMEMDDLLVAALTGGIYSALLVGEISRQVTPNAFDVNGELSPCALVKMGVEVPRGPYPDSVQTPVQLFFYQQRTATEIDDAMSICFDLFNRARVGTGTWQVEYESGSWNQSDDVLDAFLHVMRFVAVRIRRPFEGGS